MILGGRVVVNIENFALKIKEIAEKYNLAGPIKWTKDEIDKERFLITDILDDIKSPMNREEQIMSLIHLFEPLIQFYFRANKNWSASGKSLIRLLKSNNQELAKKVIDGFNEVVIDGDCSKIELVVDEILSPYGGRIWDGFRSDVDPKFKKIYEMIK